MKFWVKREYWFSEKNCVIYLQRNTLLCLAMQRVQHLRHCHLFLPGIWHKILQQSMLIHTGSCDRENWIMQQPRHIRCPSLEFALLLFCHLPGFRSHSFTTGVGNEKINATRSDQAWHPASHESKTKRYSYRCWISTRKSISWNFCELLHTG